MFKILEQILKGHPYLKAISLSLALHIIKRIQEHVRYKQKCHFCHSYGIHLTSLKYSFYPTFKLSQDFLKSSDLNLISALYEIMRQKYLALY